MNKTILAATLYFVLLSSAEAQLREDTIPPKVAGTFYSADAAELSAQVESFLLNAPKDALPADPIAIWVPHAGLVYSGQTAAAAYAALKGKSYDTVILLGPSHRTRVPVASIYPRGVFKTPTGDLCIDEELSKKIADLLPDAEFDLRAYAQEHSLEVQFPFLLAVLPKVKIVTILLGPMDLETDNRIADAIARACEGRKVLLIASSDMSHYPGGADAATVDKNSLAMVEAFDNALLPGYTQFGLELGVKNLACLFCGDGALATVMEAAKKMGANTCKILGYTNSARVMGDDAHAVGYGVAAFYKDPSGSPAAKTGPQNFFRSAEGRKQMLRLARNVIENYAANRKSLQVDLRDPEFFRLQRVFVTLKKNGNLRGCIGNPGEGLPLYEALVRMARAAASEDPRFAPVSAAEAKEIKIEISVLENFQRVKNANAIVLGTHGVIVKRGRRQGLFLPEVAEMLPNKEDFLDRLCEEKAGLPAKAWKDHDTELWTFTSLHFSEE